MPVAHRCLVGIARPVAEPDRRGIVLGNEVVPVGHPDRAVGADLRLHGRHPFLGAGQQIPAVARHEPRALFLHDALAHQVRGRLGDERDAIPIRPGIRARRVEVMAGGRRVAAVHVDLPDVRRDVVRGVELRHGLIAGPAAGAHARAEPRDVLEVAIRDRHVEARLVVRGRAKDVEGLGEAQSPGVVGGPGQELEAGAVGFEPVDALQKLHGVCRSSRLRTRNSRPRPRCGCPARTAGWTARRGCLGFPNPCSAPAERLPCRRRWCP